MTAPADERDRFDRLRLWRSDTIGPVTFRDALAEHGTAAAALDALADKRRRTAPRADIEREIDTLHRLGGFHLFRGDPGYPAGLAQLDDAPPVLTARGRRDLLDRPPVAIVGARNASAGGMRLAREFAADLGRAGFVIVSGLARGIDTAAHNGALATGTIAAIAGGIDVIYPPENEALQRRLGEDGLILAEMPPGTPTQPNLFPRRNRIISGVSLGVLVVEAALKSGSLITARLAADQGREVFAVPGSPLDARAQGCNDLLRRGAILTERADDVLAVLAPQVAPVAAPRPPGAPAPAAADIDDSRRALAGLLSPVPMPVDDLIRLSGLDPAVVQAILVDWDLTGAIERHPGGRVSRGASGTL
ncbi:MAG: DNA-processing protein DprA [Alphaproteobacteria bacterium]|nr:DNA-processing protein DprA [Alphaproteobacteria bacterium]